MAVLADVERLLERFFERSTARLFRARLQPVQIEHRVERAMERARSSQGGRTVVPARYRVRLNPVDLAAVAAQAGGPEALARHLADAALTFARGHDYHLPSRPRVAIVDDPSLQRGVVEVEAEAASMAGSLPVPDMPAVARADPPAPGASGGGGVTPMDPVDAGYTSASDAALPPGSTAMPPAALPAPGSVMDGEPATATPAGGIRGDGTQTMVFRRPAPRPTRAVLRVVGRDGREWVVEVDGTPLTLGRATDNALVIADSRVSRHHARVQARHGTLVFTDLGSTNGSRVNGVRVDECALGAGDRVVVGDTVLLVEQLPG